MECLRPASRAAARRLGCDEFPADNALSHRRQSPLPVQVVLSFALIRIGVAPLAWSLTSVTQPSNQ